MIEREKTEIIRIRVTIGGCGLSQDEICRYWKFNDLFVSSEGARILVDSKTHFVEDYLVIDQLVAGGFKFSNPNARLAAVVAKFNHIFRL